MTDHVREAAILRYAKPVTIAARVELQWTINRVAKRPRRLKSSDLLHLACAAALDRSVVRFVTRRICRHQKRDVARKVVSSGPKSTHRAKRSVRQYRLRLPAAVFKAITERDTFLRHCRHVECRRVHSERTQNVVAHVICIRFPRNARNNLAED